MMPEIVPAFAHSAHLQVGGQHIAELVHKIHGDKMANSHSTHLQVGGQHIAELIHWVHGDEDGQGAVDGQVSAFKHKQPIACNSHKSTQLRT